MEITDKAAGWVDEAMEVAREAASLVCHPLLADGNGSFYNGKGDYIMWSQVISEHKKMQTALEKVCAKLEAAKTQIRVVTES